MSLLISFASSVAGRSENCLQNIYDDIFYKQIALNDETASYVTRERDNYCIGLSIKPNIGDVDV